MTFVNIAIALCVVACGAHHTGGDAGPDDGGDGGHATDAGPAYDGGRWCGASASAGACNEGVPLCPDGFIVAPVGGCDPGSIPLACCDSGDMIDVCAVQTGILANVCPGCDGSATNCAVASCNVITCHPSFGPPTDRR